MFSKGKYPRDENHAYGSQWRPVEATLLRSEIFIERKEFVLMLKENPRGRFVRIVEYNGDRSASIIVPSTGLREFYKLLCEMIEADGKIPVTQV
jgi:hypothetical protein